MGGAGDTYTLQFPIDTLPSPAVVQPTGQPVQGVSPEAFLNMPTGQGAQTNVAKEKASPAAHDRLPISQLSIDIVSESTSLRLYTSIAWIAKSVVCKEAKPVLIASRAKLAQLFVLFNVLSTPFDLYELLRSALTTQLLTSKPGSA